jgi:hypothetical protein
MSNEFEQDLSQAVQRGDGHMGHRFAAPTLSPRSLPILKRAQAQHGQWAVDLSNHIAACYEQLAGAERAKVLAVLLRPVGLLASLSIAGGAFAHLADFLRNPALGVSARDTERVRSGHVRELVAYVGQSHPSILFQLEAQLKNLRHFSVAAETAAQSN